jgi:predicted RNase H-like nuclease (RuvC/YqgF family)
MISAGGCVQKGRALVLKLKEVQEENTQLERELQAQDAVLRQSDLQDAQLKEVHRVAKQLQAHSRTQQQQVEDLVAQAAALRKVREICTRCID